MRQWLDRLKTGLSKTSANLNVNLKRAFSLNKPRQEVLDELEEALILSDLGVECSSQIIGRLAKKNFEQTITKEIVVECVVQHICEILTPYTKTLTIPDSSSPYTILFSGINGSGKTTSLGKIAHQLRKSGKKSLSLQLILLEHRRKNS